MPKTVQIRDIDDDVYEALRVRAAEAGQSVPEMLRGEIERLAHRPSAHSWLQRTRSRPAPPTHVDIVGMLDAVRAEYPT